jgi:hypothetical protein
MVTVEQILAAEGVELSRLIGEVLGDKPWRHEMNVLNRCVKCKRAFSSPDREPIHCVCPDPIPLTWDNAMFWRDWACDKIGPKEFKDALYSVFIRLDPCSSSVVGFTQWVVSPECKPEYYLQAAAIAKLNSEKGNASDKNNNSR